MDLSNKLTRPVPEVLLSENYLYSASILWLSIVVILHNISYACGSKTLQIGLSVLVKHIQKNMKATISARMKKTDIWICIGKKVPNFKSELCMRTVLI